MPPRDFNLIRCDARPTQECAGRARHSVRADLLPVAAPQSWSSSFSLFGDTLKSELQRRNRALVCPNY